MNYIKKQTELNISMDYKRSTCTWVRIFFSFSKGRIINENQEKVQIHIQQPFLIKILRV